MTQALTTRTVEISGEASTQYSAVRENGAGIIDLTSRGRITVGGLEAVQFLNGLITNDMKTLLENTWMPAAFPNAQGRLVASVRVARLKDVASEKATCPNYLIDTEATTHESVFRTLQRFTLAGDFRVNDVSAETAQFRVQGNKAAEVVQSLLGDAVKDLSEHQATKTVWKALEVTVLCVGSGFDLIVQAAGAGELRESLLNAGAVLVSEDVFEVLRIESGVPQYGVDMDDSNVVTETNLDDVVSYTKGCYIGQEIIARIKYRGHVAKKLVGLSFADKMDVSPGDIIKSVNDKEVGRITSATYSPLLKRTIALGYVKYDYIAAGTDVKLIHEGSEIAASVTQLPFVADGQSDAR